MSRGASRVGLVEYFVGVEFVVVGAYDEFVREDYR